MSKIELQALLTKRLHLKNPVFQLEKIGHRIAGSIISETFRKKSDAVRQTMIWDALDDELGAESVRRVGTLLAYTPEEWSIDLAPVEQKVRNDRR